MTKHRTSRSQKNFILIIEFAEQLKMEILTGEKGLEKEIKGMYICDLLSWVMSHAAKGDAWITVHTHVNIVAVALMADIPCIIIPRVLKWRRQL